MTQVRILSLLSAVMLFLSCCTGILYASQVFTSGDLEIELEYTGMAAGQPVVSGEELSKVITFPDCTTDVHSGYGIMVSGKARCKNPGGAKLNVQCSYSRTTTDKPVEDSSEYQKGGPLEFLFIAQTCIPADMSLYTCTLTFQGQGGSEGTLRVTVEAKRPEGYEESEKSGIDAMPKTEIFESQGNTPQASSPVPSPAPSGEPPFRWETVIGGIGAVAAAVAALLALIAAIAAQASRKKPSPVITGKTPEKKQEDEVLAYLLQLDKNRLTIGQDKPGALKIKAWKVKKTGYEAAPEAELSVSLPPGNYIDVTPRQGQGSMTCTVSLVKGVPPGEITLPVIAEAGGVSHQAAIIVEIEGAYRIEFY